VELGQALPIASRCRAGGASRGGRRCGRGAAWAGRSRPPTRHGRPASWSAPRHSTRSLPAPRPAGRVPGERLTGAVGHGRPGRLAPPGWPHPAVGIQQRSGVAVAVGVDADDGVNLPSSRASRLLLPRRRPLAGTGLGWSHRVRQDREGARQGGQASPSGQRRWWARPVPAARGQISTKARHQTARRTGSLSCAGASLPAPRTRRRRQHHSEDYCEHEVDEVEWQGGRVYLHLGARRDGPPRG
jgi:hypothetical protein